MFCYGFKEWAEIFMYLATGVAALFALFTYRRSVSLERAKWLRDFYGKFYERENLKRVRDLLDGGRPNKILKMVVDETFEFTDYLNFFEFLGYLVDRKEIQTDDLLDLFEYYLRKIKENPPVAAYIEDPRKGYEKLRLLLESVHLTKYMFVYGTLMKGFNSLEKWTKITGATLVERAEIEGHLYDLGDYPGAIPHGGNKKHTVKGEVYRLKNPETAFVILDEYEEFYPLSPEKSLFARTLVKARLSKGEEAGVWVYFYNRDVDKKDIIASGDYKEIAKKP